MSSLRSSARRLTTQEEGIPSPLPISEFVQPCELETATSRVIASPLGLTLLQSISCGIVEGDELDSWPFVDAVFELPDRPPLFLPDPVGASQPERPAGEDREPDSARLKAQAELPALDEEELPEVFSGVPTELEAASVDDCRDECLGVVNVVQCERHGSPPRIVDAALADARSRTT
jgi:hypothetical protein